MLLSEKPNEFLILTERQEFFLKILRSWAARNNKQPMPRILMRNYFGVGVDSVAFTLQFKGFIRIIKKGGRTYFALNGIK